MLILSVPAESLIALDDIDEIESVSADQMNQLTDSVTLYWRTHYYGIMEGSSMAAPHAAGIIALWLQAKPNMTCDDVRALIKETSYNDEYTTNPRLIPSHC